MLALMKPHSHEKLEIKADIHKYIKHVKTIKKNKDAVKILFRLFNFEMQNAQKDFKPIKYRYFNLIK